MARSNTSLAGPSVDAQGHPVLDPTENVRSEIRAAVSRLDDLRVSSERRQDDVVALRAEYEDKLRNQSMAYEDKLRGKESERIDAIRAVDVNAVQRAAEVQATQALALQTQVATVADTLRVQLASNTTTADAALAARIDPLQKDIAELRKVQYEQQGQKAATSERRGTDQGQAAIILSILTLVLFAASIIIGHVWK